MERDCRSTHFYVNPPKRIQNEASFPLKILNLYFSGTIRTHSNRPPINKKSFIYKLLQCFPAPVYGLAALLLKVGYRRPHRVKFRYVPANPIGQGGDSILLFGFKKATGINH